MGVGVRDVGVGLMGVGEGEGEGVRIVGVGVIGVSESVMVVCGSVTVTRREIILNFHSFVFSLLQGVGSLQDAEHGAEDQGRDARGQRTLHLQGDQRLCSHRASRKRKRCPLKMVLSNCFVL